ncbi:ribonuclease H-like domain-containing protein [Tanacetum coccineum]
MAQPTMACNLPTRTHPMVTRDQVGTVKPNPRFHGRVSHISPLPKSPSVALSDPHWRDAMYDEYNALIKNASRVCGCYISTSCLSAKVIIWIETASSTALLQRIIASLHIEFDMTDLGALNYFLGISVRRDSKVMFLSQKKYALELLDRAHMGGFQYLTFTRPDISYAVQQVCLHMYDPREPHFAALKRVLCYVCGTLDFGFQLYTSSIGSLIAYSDVDWANYPTTRCSTSCYCVFLGDNLLLWSSKRQHTLSRSSAKAEYRGVANVVAETAWLHNLLLELHMPLLSATLVYCDNVSAICLTTNLVQHQRTKHIEIDIYFIRDMVTRGQVRVLHVPSLYQYADIFTKGLPNALFEEFRSSLSVRSSPVQTAGKC